MYLFVTKVFFQTGNDVNSMFASMSMNTNDVQLLEDLMSDAPTSNSPSAGVNFNSILRAAFTHADPKSAKKTVKLSSFLRFWDL